MKIIVLEGPSGCGKSTFITRAVQTEGVSGVSVSLTPNNALEIAEHRMPNDPYLTGIHSIANDTYRMGLALKALAEGARTVFIDRLFISQVVYHTIRTDTPEDFHWGIHEDNLARSQAFRLASFVRGQSMYRGIPLPEVDYDEITYWIMCPPKFEELEANRKKSGKIYPAGRKDFDLYNQIAAYTDFPLVSSQVELLPMRLGVEL